MARNWLCSSRSWVVINVVFASMSQKHRNGRFDLGNLVFSRQFQFLYFFDSENRACWESVIKIAKVIFKILKWLPLCPMVRIIIQVSEKPSILLPPVGKFCSYKSNLTSRRVIVIYFFAKLCSSQRFFTSQGLQNIWMSELSPFNIKN